ncbi:MAG: DUF1800 domain-containing protein [Acidobacteriota bacterium]|nr:DUF1800 domain-containing protein [Acidobacteriota bacterium]
MPGKLLPAFVALFMPLVMSAKPKPPKPDAQFRVKLSKDRQIAHALDRLTFGPRRGDFEQVRKQGLKKWVNRQLHPEQIPENPALNEKLLPLETLRLSTLEISRRYPVQQNILAALTGKPALPKDPNLQSTVFRYASYYKLKTDDPEKNKTVASLEPRESIEQLLSADEIKTLKTGKPAQKRAVLARIPASKLDATLVSLGAPLRNQLQSVAPTAVRRRIFMLNSPQSAISFDLLSSKLDRAIYSNRQLEEQLADFWYNHFNVYLDKGNERFLVPAYERDAIRPHVLGNFRDLLLATAQSPAMLYYLDNYQSVAPPKPGDKRKNVRGLNENYGRELLELHTLGVDGGYTQKDVTEVARCFTGWSIDEPLKGSAFHFNEKTHDSGEKTVLGTTIPAGRGIEDGLQVLDSLVHHPSTARFISRKLAQRFVADNPPEALIERMAETFRKSDGNIRGVMKTMLESREFWSNGAYRAKLKSPLEMVASAARAVNADVEDAFGLANQIATLGEPLYRKVEPTGYPNTSAQWINSAALLARFNFALNFAQNRLQGVQVAPDEFSSANPPDMEAIARRILFTKPSVETTRTIASALTRQQAAAKNQKAPSPGLVAGFIIGSPDFQRR